MAISGKLGAVYQAMGTSTTFTDEVTTKDANNKRYTITNTAKRYWDDSAAVTVKKNSVIQTGGFTIEYAGGVVEFNTPLSGSDVVTVSGKYFTPTQCATFFNWKLDINQDTADVTTFASNGWRELLPVVKGWSVSAEGYWADGSFLSALGSRVILVLYVDYASDDRYEGYVIIKKNSIDTPVNSVVKENVDFEGAGQLYFHS